MRCVELGKVHRVLDETRFGDPATRGRWPNSPLATRHSPLFQRFATRRRGVTLVEMIESDLCCGSAGSYNLTEPTMARDLARRATDSAVRGDAKETGALWLAFQALREAEVGNGAAARQAAARALALAPGRDVKAVAAVALARSGEAAQSRTILESLQKSESTNTLLKVLSFPMIEASIDMAQQAPDRAIVALEPSLPYELAGQALMYPEYLRGLAYLAQKNGPAAAPEFQKLIDHAGIVQNFVLGSLARLQLARAYAISGDTAKAKAAYQDFLKLWKDADPDIPILKEAKAEYAKLQ